MEPVWRYAELRPDQLRARLADVPAALVPWGALEWHGPHLPFGLDGLVAEAFCDQLSARSGAVVLPTFYLPITSLPHPQSLSIHSDLVRAVWDQLIRELSSAGFVLVCLVSGHYAQGHEWVLSQMAESLTSEGLAMVLAGTPLALLNDPELLDHAGKWETSQLLHYRPDLVDLEALPPGHLPGAHQVAVLGEDPRRASAQQGQAVLERALRVWSEWIDRLLQTEDRASLLELYRGRRAAYQAYVDRYYQGSWEQAIQSWWDQYGSEASSSS